MMVGMRGVYVVALACSALAVTGCARLHARGGAVGPPLEIPAPPPRVIAAVDPPAAAPPLPAEQIIPGADDPPTAPQLPADTTSRRPARGAAAAPAARQEKPEVPPAPPPRPAAPTNPPSPTLQTTTNVGEVEQKVRATIALASRDLGRIDARALNAEAKAQYDIAKRFVQQAGDALTAKNFVFAGQLADKAAQLAALLLTH
jgi:hypothetical protein